MMKIAAAQIDAYPNKVFIGVMSVGNDEKLHAIELIGCHTRKVRVTTDEAREIVNEICDSLREIHKEIE